MPNIDLLTIELTPENIRLIEDEAISLFRIHSKTEPINFEHWLLRYIPTEVMGDSNQKNNEAIARELYQSGSWILQVLGSYRSAIIVAIVSKRLNPSGQEKSFIRDRMQFYRLHHAQTQKENEFLEVFLEYCKRHHQSNRGLAISADGVEEYFSPDYRKSSLTKRLNMSAQPFTQQETTVLRMPDRPYTQTAVKERDVFASFHANFNKKIAARPMTLGLKASNSDLTLKAYAQHVDDYKERIAAQIQQKQAAEAAERARIKAEEDAEKARKRAEELAEYERKKAEEKAEWERRQAANLAARMKERRESTTFNTLLWIFCAIAVAAKAVLLFVEPITLFAIAPIAGIDILYGFMVSWVGKSNERSRGRCIAQTLIEVGMSTIVVVIAFLMFENVLPILIAQGAACLISIVATLIMRGKTH